MNQNEEPSQTFYFDAVCFKNIDTSDFQTDGRADMLVMIPYQTLRFEKRQDIFTSIYEIHYDIYDTTGNKIISDKVRKTVEEKDYSVTQGSTAGFEIISKSFFLNAGNYNVQINLIDLLSGKTLTKTRSISIVKFEKYRISMSGIMLVSSIEENKGKYKITPHISDNIGILADGFFIFFEVYNNKNFDSLDFVYEIINDKEKIIYKSDIFSFDVKNKVNQLYKKIIFPANIKQGKYVLRLIALTRSDRISYNEDDYLAITERTLLYQKVISGTMIEDINLAIRYLKYVASPSEINYIEQGNDDNEKRRRFEEFWKNLDPSPSTDRNEAFEEYFSRIQYANKNFKSYTEGWLTDMGMVYIVFGQPDYIDKSDTYSTRTVYVKWTYLNNREFLFSDETGMGDFRLIRPYTITEKYKFGR
jgi:GWxTD domain-containing protein